MNSLPKALFCSRELNSPIGVIEVYASDEGICAVNMRGHNPPKPLTAEKNLPESDLTKRALQQILEYLSGERRVIELPLDLTGLSPFQKKALRLCAKIPFGEVLTYGQLAGMLGSSSASRAVGGAMARNPLPILIPCHRVVAADGRLTGYSAAEGIHTKKRLLELEGHQVVGEKLA